MNCKQGDMAVIVRSTAGNLGKIVECVALQLHPAYAEHATWGVRCSGPLRRPTWSASDYEWCRVRGFDEVLKDSDLRPLRDREGDDEMVRLAGRPVGTPQDA